MSRREQRWAGKREDKKIQMTSTADIIYPAIFWLLYPAVRKTGFISRNIVQRGKHSSAIVAPREKVKSPIGP